jgi:hypothetical protein
MFTRKGINLILIIGKDGSERKDRSRTVSLWKQLASIGFVSKNLLGFRKESSARVFDEIRKNHFSEVSSEKVLVLSRWIELVRFFFLTSLVSQREWSWRGP